MLEFDLLKTAHQSFSGRHGIVARRVGRLARLALSNVFCLLFAHVARALFSFARWPSFAAATANNTILTIDLNGASFGINLLFRVSVGRFRLAEKQIGVDDATALAVALKRSTSVTSVHLQCQAPFCSSWFRRVFIGARRVRWSVAGNRIGDAGAVALADALKSNKSVAEIYLRRNARQKALLPGASSVSGSGNDVGVVGVEAWGNALLSNTGADVRRLEL